MKSLKAICLLLVLTSFGLAAFNWQSVAISDPSIVVSQSGLGAYPGISLFMAIVLVAMFVSRYLNLLTQRILFGLVALLGLAVNVGPAKGILFGPFDITTAQIAHATGISGWQSQLSEVVRTAGGPSAFAFLYLVTTLAFLALLTFSPREKSPKPTGEVPNREPELWVN